MPIRRRYADQPLSRLAIWARRIALFSLVATLLSIVIVRSGILEIEPALATFGGALLLAIIGILLALASFVVIWREGLGGLGYSVSAIAIGLAINAYPLYLGYKWYKLPALFDVTTDPIDPPRFEAVARLRPRGANPVAYPGLYAAEQQRAAYPDIEPLMVGVTPAAAYEAAHKLIEKRKWRIVDAREPQINRREGRIEAVARTPIMGFRDDIVVRVRAVPDGARIDIRSASRYGHTDFGTNASRIRSLVEDIEALAETPVKERKPPPPPKPAPAKPGPAGQPTAKR
jgi:uncharacterized protein (DUF1499 family)